MITLYEFAISHYCEKIRWALDYKRLPYEKKTLIPGAHVFTTRKVTPSSNVPIIKDGDTIVQGSNHIITYLDDKYPDHALTPSDPGLAKSAIEWEAFLDKQVGIHLRRAAYNILLRHPSTLVPIFCEGKPSYSKFIMRISFPVLSTLMRKAMNIDDESAERSRKKLVAALARVKQAYSENTYLVGNEFTRADLTAGALLAPLNMPEEYGTGFKEPPPPEYLTLIEELRADADPALAIYDRYRTN